jgi:drug/metabolite transporter (DMT)-like permease
MLTVMWVAYYASLPHLALGIAAATYYTLPIFITLFAALFIGDRIGPMGWCAVLAGFAGVLLILRPDAGGFNAYAVLPLLAAVLYALAMTLTRTKCREEDPLILSLALHLSFIAVGCLETLLIALSGGPAAGATSPSFLFGTWTAMGMTEWFTMVLLAAAAIIGSVGAAVAYQAGPPAIVATFDFAYLAFAGLWASCCSARASTDPHWPESRSSSRAECWRSGARAAPAEGHSAAAAVAGARSRWACSNSSM